ncbi:helix-turn-helix transcriptional regulator [Streptomyces lavendulae]|uniref:helix-turn-helix domain-containing protein n=1 Tax=Streptomyces lavendulae TaxID=1914 RepID=UPI0031ECCD90
MPGQTGTEQLSESERRVAALAAYGYTNREISAKLCVTVSTVEQPLTRAHRKLGISRRQDLPMGGAPARIRGEARARGDPVLEGVVRVRNDDHLLIARADQGFGTEGKLVIIR